MLLTHNPNRKEKNSSEQSEIKRNDAFRTAYVKTKTENDTPNQKKLQEPLSRMRAVHRRFDFIGRDEMRLWARKKVPRWNGRGKNIILRKAKRRFTQWLALPKGQSLANIAWIEQMNLAL